MFDRRKNGPRRGEDHPGATLTDAEVDKVRQMRETEKMTYEAIAVIMDSKKSTIATICKYRRR